jgi:hypothetical protein
MRFGSRAYELISVNLLWFFIKLLVLVFILFYILFVNMFRLSDIIIPLLFLFWSSSFYSLLWLIDLILNYFWIYLFSFARLFCSIRFLSNIIWFWIISLLSSLIIFYWLIFSLLFMHLGGFLASFYLSTVSTGYPTMGATVNEYSFIRLVFYLIFLLRDA